MATLAQIKSPVWSYAISGGGAIAEGLAAIRQCIDIIIRTTPGTDPLRPSFGSDVWQWVDQPADIGIPNIKKAILDAVAIWEPRVTITSIAHRLEVSHLYLDVTYRLTDGTMSDLLSIIINNGGVSSNVLPRRLVLQGLFPPNPNSYQYTIECSLDGAAILPLPPDNGFATPDDMLQWVRSNWINYGQWYLTADSIVGYIISDYLTGTLAVGLLAVLRFSGGIPGLPIGRTYRVEITVDGVIYSSSESLYSADQVRQWAQDNIGDLGTWEVVTTPGSFNDDFNDDFDTYRQVLVIYTDQAEEVNIQITTEAE
ncbi:GPW/gp25 family protein [Chitinophaga sp. CF418]|uniref:GPW/gp25 family protein n=1 Tax=Chitinophaga sp. CF418 TaxID=1855287 RepID=UPI00165EC346|nr:GPW/gp25 family protein [Chitinophaga sp. CF418]